MTTVVPVNSNLNRDVLLQVLRTLPGRIVGTTPDPEGFAAVFGGTFAHKFFTELHRNFMLRSRGGSDEFGRSWKPLSPATIRRKQHSLSQKNAAKFKAILKQKTAAFSRTGMPVAQARVKATRLAYAAITQTVPIGIDTGEMEKSLRPGRVVGGRYTAPDKQIADTHGKDWKIGTRVAHAKYFHRKRPLWPPAKQRAVWIKRSVKAGRDAIVQRFRQSP